VTDTQPGSGSAAPSYTSADLRDRLEHLVIADLLGPVGGLEELVDERSVRGRYLVGMLAPRGSSGIPEEYDDADPGGPDSEDGTTDAPPPKAAAAMLPSTIGLTFAVAAEASALCVTARWGHYDRVMVEEERFRRTDGGYRPVWQRTQVDVTSPPIPLLHGKIAPWSPDPERPDVMVQGIMRKRAAQWIVTLFLVNGQEEPKVRKDSAWVFQPELVVESSDGAPIFQRRALPHEQLDLDEQLMAMLYRNQVEFAVGHGVAVDAAVAQDAEGRPIFDRAVRVWTAIVPAYEVPQTTPPQPSDPGYEQLASLTVDMQTLAEVPDGHFATHLAPLADSYAAWIARQERRLGYRVSGIGSTSDATEPGTLHPDPYTLSPEPDLAPYLTAAQAALANCRQALTRIRAGIALLDHDPQAAAAFRFANRAMALQRVHSLLDSAGELYASVARRAKADMRGGVWQVSRHHATSRTMLIATAIRMCCTWVRVHPM